MMGEYGTVRAKDCEGGQGRRGGVGFCPIRAGIGSGLATFPEPERIIPENEGINPHRCAFSRMKWEVMFSHIWTVDLSP